MIEGEIRNIKCCFRSWFENLFLYGNEVIKAVNEVDFDLERGNPGHSGESGSGKGMCPFTFTHFTGSTR